MVVVVVEMMMMMWKTKMARMTGTMTTTLRRGLTGGWSQASVTVDPALNGISALIIWSTKPLNVKSEYKLSRTEMLKTYSCCPADSRLGIK